MCVDAASDGLTLKSVSVLYVINPAAGRGTHKEMKNYYKIQRALFSPSQIALGPEVQVRSIAS